MKIKNFMTALLASALVVGAMTVSAMAADTLPAADANGDIILTEDVVLASTLTIEEDVTIDLNGFKITSENITGEQECFTPLILVNNADVCIIDSGDNGVIVPGDKNDIKSNNNEVRTIQVSKGVLTVDGAVVKGQKGINTRYAGVAIVAASSDVNIINGSAIYGGDSMKDIADASESFYFNNQGRAGAAIESYSSNVVISDSFIYGGNGTISERTPAAYFSGKTMSDGDVAIMLRASTGSKIASTLVAENSVFNGGNSALYNPADAIDAQGSTVATIKNCTVTGGSAVPGFGNYGVGGDGIQFSGTPNVTIEDSTIVAGTGKSSTKNGALEIGNLSANPVVVVKNSTLVGGDHYAVGGSGKLGTFTFVDTTIKSDGELIETNTVPDIFVEGTLTVSSDSGSKSLDNVNLTSIGGAVISGTEGGNDIIVEKSVAKIGNEYYTALDTAIEAANGAEITLVADAELATKLNNKTINIDLNGYTMNVNVGSNYIIGNNSISNGTVDISNASSSQNIFGLAQYATPATTLTMDKVNFVGDGYNSGYAVFEIGNSGADVALTVTNSTIDLKNDNASQGGFVKGYGANCVLVIDDSEITLDNTDMFSVNIAATISDSVITAENLTHTVFRNFGGEVNNTTISVTNSENGIRNSGVDYDLVLKNGTSVKMNGAANTDAGEIGDLVLAAGCTVTVDSTSELLVEASTIANPEDVSGNVVSKADTIYVQYKKTDIDDNDIDTLEGADTYEIVLAGYNAEKINELASADLTFKFVGTPYTGAAMTYTVTPADGVTLSQIGDRYMFNYNGVDKYEETGTAIVIGTIEVSGYGKYYLGTKVIDTNAVYATEIRDNIVDGFVPSAGLVINEDMADDDGMVGEVNAIEIVVPTRELVINVDFPNAIENNKYDYQQMKVTVSGGDLDEALIIELGKDYTIDLSAYTDKTGCAASAVFADGAYKVTLTKLLTADVAYNVEISGAGYRTTRYTVTMQGEDKDGKVLNFWNNVKDNETAIEEGKKTAKVTYLAGDIVKDSLINIYDLSAVVSYFGETGLVGTNNDYAKYDLNRDGKIDSKDVAYVLVSWGN